MDGLSATTKPRADVRLLLGTQLLFNVGFYAVVPFIAIVLTEDFGLAAAATGLVLGVRTFAQQGMFLIGGELTDRFGARPIILLGCAIRIAGFAGLAASLWSSEPRLWIFVVGTVATGLGGALFSPGINTLVAAVDTARSRDGAQRATVFAWLTVAGEVGAATGPLIGAALFGWGFAVVAAVGAAFFGAIAVMLWLLLPAAPVRAHTEPAGEANLRGSATPWAALRDRRFVAFSGLHSVDLLAYNQLYLTLPLELRQSGAGPQFLGYMFAWVSILTLALQLPVSHWCSRVGAAVALRTGYALSAASFLGLAAVAILAPPDSARIAAVMLATTLLTLGHLTASPTALSQVSRFAGTNPTGSYFGLLASCGGIAVLVGNLLVGVVADRSAGGVLAWLFLAVPLLISAWLMPRVARADLGGVACARRQDGMP